MITTESASASIVVADAVLAEVGEVAQRMRVIRYLPTNLRAREIAFELFVSTNTIRTHLRHIYAKLGVHNRAEAVVRGLLRTVP